jgi:UDPglucose--hexose-1-phosphate uridylyltransferase
VPELRRDPIAGRWVIIATERARRPIDFRPEPVWTRGRDGCPFCPGSEDQTPPEVLRLSGDHRPEAWTLRVVPNKFPALLGDEELHASGEGIYDRMSGVGVHEVIVETPDHGASLGRLPVTGVSDVLSAYRERLLALRKDPRLEYVLIFKNHGAAAGASLEHPHSQLIGMPIVPELVQEELDGATRYYRLKERCAWCDIVRQEQRDGTRLVLAESGFLAVAPFAPRVPFETWILPATHQAAFESTEPGGLEALARLLRELMARFERVLRDPPYNYVLHTAPFRAAEGETFHWHLELMPKLTRVAGFEWGTGFFINPTPPEEAARFLRNPEDWVPDDGFDHRFGGRPR